ncbi:ribokinase [Bacteroidota bacterium]
MDSKNIVVLGSTNTDMVIKTDHLPLPGETILGGTFFMNPGGKGANQAVAAARLGGKVIFISKTGDDIFGKQAVQNFDNEGINTTYMNTDPDNPSGVALITVDSNAENCIVVAPGSNGTLNEQDVNKAKSKIENSSILLMQLEVPISTVIHAAKIGSSNGVKVILNPAPACKIPDELYKHLEIITPNETEAELLTGVKVTNKETAREAALVLKSKGVKTVIITMGSKGAYVFNDEISEIIPAPKVNAVDTTAAGDVFNGALSVAISDNLEIIKAIEFASKAAAISVIRLGAQTSAPYRKEIS